MRPRQTSGPQFDVTITGFADARQRRCRAARKESSGQRARSGSAGIEEARARSLGAEGVAGTDAEGRRTGATTRDSDRKIARPFCRLDRFVVPDHARADFLDRVRAVHAPLRTQDRFIQDFLLEEPAGPGKSTIVTMVEWEDAAWFRGCGSRSRPCTNANFNPREMLARLGIEVEQGNNQQVTR